MTGKQYLSFRLGLNKKAFLKSVLGTAKDVAKPVVEGARDAWAVTLPLTGILAAYLIHKATSPKAVADNAALYAANAMEEGSLLESIKDLQDLKQQKSFKTNAARKYHDQFI